MSATPSSAGLAPAGALVLRSAELRRWARRALIAGIGVLLVLHLAALGLAPPATGTAAAQNAFAGLFDVNAELSVPTWWSSLWLLVAAGSTALLALHHRDLPGRASRRWMALALVSCVLSAEQLAAVAEELSLPLKESLDFQGALAYVWIAPYVLVAVACAVAVWPALRALDPWWRRRIILAGAVFGCGAVGMELLGALLAARGLQGGAAYAAVTTLEAGLELVGVALFVTALLGSVDALRAGRPLAVNVVAVRRWFGRGAAAAVSVLVALHAVSLAIAHGVGTDAVPGGAALARQFNLNEELNLSTWVATALLASAAGCLAVLGRVAAVTRGPWARHWYALAALFLFLSLDEATSLHERLITPVREALSLGGVLTYAWLVPYSLLCLVCVMAFWPWLRALPRRTGGGLILAAALYGTGAIGGELVGGWLFSAGLRDSAGYLVAAMAEECLELAGVVVFVAVLLGHLAVSSPVVLVDGRGHQPA